MLANVVEIDTETVTDVIMSSVVPPLQPIWVRAPQAPVKTATSVSKSTELQVEMLMTPSMLGL